MARIAIFAGGARSGRERAVDALAVSHWGHALLVVPTRHEAHERADRIVRSHGLAGAWDAAVVSFEDFALRLLRGAGTFAEELGDTERRAAIACAIDRVRATGALDALGGAVETAGFADHMLRVIAKLKQAAIDPQRFRAAIAARARASWLDPIVAGVYEAYQDILHTADAYDRVGVYWRARVVLDAGAPRLFDRVRHVVFDGFDDFTPSEFRVIERLPDCLETLGFGLACDAETGSRRDLYAVPLATLGHLRRAFPEASVQTFAEPAPQTRTEFVAADLFWRDAPRPPAGLREDLALQPCHDALHECEWIGRAVKSLIVDGGADPNAIAVVYRRLENAAPRLRRLFAEFQVPVRVHAPRTLNHSSFAAFLLRVLDVAPDWGREDVLDVLASQWAGAPPEHAGAFGYLARTAGIIEGRREWETCLTRLRAWLDTGTGERRGAVLRRVPGAVAAVDSLLARAAALAAWLDGVPPKSTRAGFANALLNVVNAIGPERTIGLLDADTRAFETRALGALRAALRRMRVWGRRLPEASTMTQADFVSELREAFAAAAIDDDEAAPGVQAMSAETARYRTYDHVFLAGLNEGAFPAPPPADAIYSDEDWDDLERAGARAEARSRQMEREMLLFHHVLGRARRGAWLSWSVTGADGRPLAPSPFIDDVRGLLGRSGETTPRSASFLPTTDEAASLRELRHARGAGPDIERAFPEAFAGMAAGIEAERHRASAAPFDAYDGVLSNPALVASLTSAYGPGHAFSAAQLETYAECPFRFFLERVLGVEDDAAPDEEFDPRTRGRILHDVLHEFHAAYVGQPIGAIAERDARESMLRICGTVFDRHARAEVTAPRGVVRTERARMEAQLLRYLALAREAGDRWAPSHFEVGFGDAHAAGDDPLTRPQPFPLETDAGTVLLSGRIDRIDRMDNRVRVVDYKTTIRHQAKDVAGGVSLQMPLYAVALEQSILPDTECAEARLVQPGKAGSVDAMQKARGKWPEREAGMRNGVARAVTGIRRGHFPPAPHGECCALCARSRVCRFEAWRTDRKVQDDAPADA